MAPNCTAHARCIADQGVVLIPAFSINRTQELLYELEHIIHRNKKRLSQWNDLEIIVDSPLAADFTDTYRQLKKYWDKESWQRTTSDRHPMSISPITKTGIHSEHPHTVNYLKKHPRPANTISASGMCAGGRIVNSLKSLIGDKRTDIVFVGYQAHGTPGRNIQTWGPK